MYLLIRLGAMGERPTAEQTILVFGAISLPTGLLVSFAISRVLLKPINTLISRMNALAEGDYAVRIHPGPFWRRLSPIREVSDSFDRLAQELEGTQMLHRDLINDFSHEFKTPIMSIAGFAQILRSGTATPAQQREYLDIIERESLRLSQMATSVMALTRVESHSVLTDVEEYDLSEQIRSCILLLQPKWEEKQIEFSLDLPDRKIRANEELMKQVWIDLLDNAVKFSEGSGRIWVTIGREKEQVTVAIRNQGPQIPPGKQDKIFRKFYQADESHAAEGNGIGLAIVKRVVDLHGGQVAAASREGSTTFTVTLPQKTVT